MKRNISIDEALERAREFFLENEVQRELDNGATPWEALYEWDLLNENEF